MRSKTFGILSIVLAGELLIPVGARADRGIPWSFLPIHSTPPPHSRFDKLARNEIDRFVFAKLEGHGLRPSSPADRLTLLRRVTVDLIGLPPTPAEIISFLADRSPNAYAKVVDRLLASPAYGEYWGRHWLDVVRYGESDGYEQNHLRANAWLYRDYVISAFNSDKPFDRFVAEQLAADQMAPTDASVAPATGFLIAGIHDTVGNQTEVGTRQQRANDLDDIVTTTAAAFLGLTVNCARCHDHKFDPIPQRDYYGMASIFSDVHFGERPLPPRSINPETARRSAEIQSEISRRNDEILDIDEEGIRHLLGDASRRRAPVNARRNVEKFATTTARYLRFTISSTTDGYEPCIDELQIFGPNSSEDLATRPGAIATASSLLPGYAIHQISHLNDGQFGNGHSWISNERGAGWAQIELPRSEPIARVVWGRDGDGQFHDRLPLDYEISISEDGRSWRRVADGSDRLRGAAKYSDQQILAALPPALQARRNNLSAEVQSLQSRELTLQSPSVAYIGQFSAAEPVFMLQRGDVMQRGDRMSPSALSRLDELPPAMSLYGDHVRSARANPNSSGARPELAVIQSQSSSGAAPNITPTNPRLAYARWITDPRNPLTVRVIVNRLWAGHFGTGIVGTPSDFGWNGERPTHPELLDWLATDLVSHGWTLKRMHRMMVMSYTYQQSSADRPEETAKDADDRMLWRMPLRRMEAETVRDSILAVSGKLDRSIGGPGYELFTYRVENVSIFGPREDQGPDTWRRGVYQIPARGIHDDLLGSLDCPDSSERTPRRTSTTTALQALCLFNGKFVNDQARYMAVRVRTEAGADPAQQVRSAFLHAFGRAPNATERADSLRLVENAGVEPLCRALLNATEFIYY